MWRKNLRVHPHFPPGDRGGVRRDDLQKDFYALLHLRDADQFLEAQGVVGAIVEVGSGDSLLGEGNPVRAAADGAVLCANSRRSHGSFCIFQAPGIPHDARFDVEGALAHGDGEGGESVRGIESLRSPFNLVHLLPQDVLFKAAHAVAHMGMFRAAREGGQMDDSLVFSGIIGVKAKRKRAVQLHGHCAGIAQDSCAGSGVHGTPQDIDLRPSAAEGLVVQAGDVISVNIHRIGEITGEAFRIKACHPPADFLVHGEGNVDRPVGKSGIMNQDIQHGNKLCDPRLVVGAKDCGAVRGNQIMPDQPGQEGILPGIENELIFFMKKNGGSVIIFYEPGADTAAV